MNLLLICGILLLLAGAFQPLLEKAFRIPPPEEKFTTPAFQKAARARRRGARWAMALLGASLTILGGNGFGLPTPLPQIGAILTFLGGWGVLAAMLVISLRAKP